MDHVRLGRSGLKVPALSFGAGTFGGQGPLFSNWGTSDAKEATRLVDICLEAGINLFDTADVYSNGASEEVLGAAIKGRRDKVLISTKLSLPIGDGPNDAGSSRSRLIDGTEVALRRLGREVEWVRYVNGAHRPPNSVSEAIDFETRILAWYDKYLKPVADVKPVPAGGKGGD